MTIHRYRSDDASAPTLNGQAGSLIDVLKACLVDGYGAKAGAGWTLEIAEVANNNKILLRNNSVSGTGRFFRIKDDGVLYSGHGGNVNQIATIVGCESYTDIDNLSGNFPNVDGSDVSDNATYYGQSFIKCNSNNNAGPYPWEIVADDRTCIFRSVYSESGKTDPYDATFTDTEGYNVVIFGDFNPLNDVADAHACWILANHFTTSASASSFYAATNDLHPATQVNGKYINRGLEGNPGAIEARWGVRPEMVDGGYQGGLSINSNQYYEHYPSPRTGGVIIQDIYIAENTNAVERTWKHTYYEHGLRGIARGIKGCPHGFMSVQTNRLGALGDTFVKDGRTYLLSPLGVSGQNCLSVIDLTGPWT